LGKPITTDLTAEIEQLRFTWIISAEA
jgi:hypothetical protein